MWCKNNQLAWLDLTQNDSLVDIVVDSNRRQITLTNNTFDLSSLEGFDISKATNWKGGTISGTILTFDPDVTEVSYTYEMRLSKTETFTLTTAAVNTYTVTYDANGGTGTMSDITVTEGEAITLPQCLFQAPSGKKFKAWKIGSREYAVGATYTVTGNTNVKAVWQSASTTPTTPTTPTTTTTTTSSHSHEYQSEWTSDAAAHWHECVSCDDIIDKADHEYGEWVVTLEMTADYNGLKERNCKACGYTQVEEMHNDAITANPQTGDTNNMALWIIGLLMSGGMFMVISVIRKKKAN